MESPVKKTTASTHPKVSVMVETAIKTLGERKGSSLIAINKFISANYSVDVQKLSARTKKFLKSAVECGDIVQTSGKGANGSFKIANKKAKAKPMDPEVKPEKASDKPSDKSPVMKTNSAANKKAKAKPKDPEVKSENASDKPSVKSPVMKTNSAGDQEFSADATSVQPSKAKKPRFSVPSKSKKSKVSLPAKVKKPKKLMAKTNKEPKPVVSSEEKPDNTATPPKPEKGKGATKTAKAKKSPKPKKPASNQKKTVSKKPSAGDGQE